VGAFASVSCAVQEQSYRFGKIGSANGPNAMI
jgi:hypothetical protein